VNEEERILRFLGLARRAGFVESGYDAVVTSVKLKTAKMIIMATDISRNTLDKLLSMAETTEEPMPEIYRFSTMDSLGNAIGKPPRALVAITDDGFTNKLKTMLEGFDKREEHD